MFINKGEKFWNFNIPRVEEKYNAKYINDFAINQNGNWTDDPVSVFYAYNPDISKGHGHYFGLFEKNKSVYICNAISVANFSWSGIKILETGEILFSRWRHDYRGNDDFFVDGGHNYSRFGGDPTKYKKVDLKIIKDDMIVLDTVVHKDEIFPDYAITYKNNSYHIAIIGYPERIVMFEKWLNEHVPTAVLENIGDWTYFSDHHQEVYDVVLNVSFENENDQLMFKLKFGV